MTDFKGKTAIVTGASRGIGRGIAIHFGSLGANVVATARNTAALDRLVAELGDSGTRALAVTADLSVEEAIQRIASEALAEFGRIDMLVNKGAIVAAPRKLDYFAIR